jgi:subtilisin family serine protease
MKRSRLFGKSFWFFGAPLAAFFLGNYLAASEPQKSTNDFSFPKQRPLFEKLHVFESWQMTKGSPKVVVGVIETGFDFFHPNLKDQFIPGFYAPGGYHLDIYHNIAHGTFVSSIIAAQGIQGGEMIGLAPDCKILTASTGIIEQPLLRLKSKFDKEHPNADLSEFQKEMMKHMDELKEFGTKWTTYMALSHGKAIRYLADHGVKVINISCLLRKALILSPDAWNELEDAFKYAASKDVIIVIGAGNDAKEYDDYPGDLNSVIVVGATSLNDKRWEVEMPVMGRKIKQGSSYGKRLTVMAPSENMVGCAPHDKRFYSCEQSPMGPINEEFKGLYETVPEGATSSATPIVISLVALVYSLRPDLPAKSVMEIIRQGCDDIGDPGYDIYTGYGRVNFLKTLNLAKDWKE